MLFRKSIIKSDVLDGWTDCHCHILPGVDDGIHTLDDALATLTYYDSIGIKEVWLTPHVMEDIANTTTHLKEVFSSLQQAWKGNAKLHLSAENMIDSLFAKRLEQDDVLLWGERQDMMLVETSYIQPPVDFRPTLKRIMAKGVFPLLAHPERYIYMDEDDYDKLHDMGVRFQLNLASLTGGYGPRARQVAELLLKKGFYDKVGTDTHSLSFIQSTFESKSIKSSTMERLARLMHKS